MLISGAEMIGVGQQSAPPQPASRRIPTIQCVCFSARSSAGLGSLGRGVARAGECQISARAAGYLRWGDGFGLRRRAIGDGAVLLPDRQKVYLDTLFFQDMKPRMGGGGDFAYSYVVAHEIGHHVQNLLGILPR